MTTKQVWWARVFGDAGLRLRTGRIALRLEYALPAAVVLFALALRLFRLGEWSFWGDEYVTVSGEEDGFNYSLLRRSLATDLVQLAVRLLGHSEWAARLVPALIGALTVLALYFLLKPLTPKRVPLLAAGLLAISPWHLFWSQNARFYTLLLLFCSLSLVFYYRGLAEDRPAFLILALLFLGFAARERLVSLLLVPVFALYPLLLWLFRFERPAGLRWSRLLLFFSPLLIGAALFVLPYALSFTQWMRNFGPPNNSPQRILAGVVIFTTVPVTCLAAFGGVRLIRAKNPQGLFFALVAGVPVLLMMLISLAHYAANRYVFFSLVGFIVLAAWAIQDLYDQAKGNARTLATGVLAVLVAASLVDVGLYFSAWNGNRQDWKAALTYIRAHAQPGDQVVVNDGELGEYYLGKRPDSYANIDRQAPPAARVWFVDEEGARNAYPQYIAWIQEHSRLVAVFDIIAPSRSFPMRVYLFAPGLEPIQP